MATAFTTLILERRATNAGYVSLSLSHIITGLWSVSSSLNVNTNIFAVISGKKLWDCVHPAVNASRFEVNFVGIAYL
jgi:hypothetical protein